ncbi:MAG: hypothetical protein A2655_03705 [Candidatus Yanofskybacteria bacterium RIFCSPHIGHO2_01_FULL_43_42]|uniref:Uncharacterized protein n=1 Tax=Candidatus Yanofskybacteria bacterium RIFCSPLOWO2_01_FULL_43_22 TaxID=1802695 RepID=A0A1F8GF44_9BACT|nr:MAG: hypothetical protein A2655_03705 [Candidatus Yanofskybacteria bacterium RIFCSPHIGHO2_01_FULL_43_42]OGN12917.1 MAG: hypothetical protein A3D48_03320 [Candidatus Yanofskybacteria bacterium RIFCSPHIGHO2_02_FULL_43_17]OGN24004.1 MAG: hypothetical protein A3A13_02945 [Candidatus Yanofskybacteria bacterium RIFCSPLOWO2_01_FULL_43_22]
MSSDKELTVEQFKLACISNNEFTDEQIWTLIQNVVLSSEEDVREFVAVLHKYRPDLEERFFNHIVITID